MSIIKWKSLDEIVYRANNTLYGLAAGIWTKNVDTANFLARSIRAGVSTQDEDRTDDMTGLLTLL